MSRRAQRPAPWWSERGPEICEFCLQGFHIEAGYYCADCDHPVCPVCAVRLRARRVVLCPGCHSGGGD